MASNLTIPFLDLSRVNEPLQHELHEAACRVIDSGRYLHGPETEGLERELALSCGAAGCVAVSNGLDALRLILKGYILLGRLQPGDEVVVAANTYIASVLAISDAGLVPVLAEPDPATLNLSTESAERVLSPRTRAIMTVHLYGRPCWDDALKALAQKHHLLVIEDNAQAIGAVASTEGMVCSSRTTGGLGHAAAFSFYPTKNIGALGDAGAVTSDDSALLEAVSALANYGSDRRYHNIYTGYNCRMDEIQAAMLHIKLRHLPQETERRRKIASIYDSNIDNPLITKPQNRPGESCVYHQYVVLCDRRDDLQRYLQQLGIGTDIHYAVPPHRQPCYAGTFGDSYPITEYLADRVLSLPIGCITPQQAYTVCAAINAFS